jgi:hypothetical protein
MSIAPRIHKTKWYPPVQRTYRPDLGIMTSPIIEEWFKKAQEYATQGNLVVLREDGECLLLPAIPSTSVKPEMTAAIEQIIPSTTTKRKVAVIGETSWASGVQPSLQAANQAMPFWGLLMGFASIGHDVWVFRGSADLLCAGCRGADVLIVDSASLGSLPGDWQVEAARVMRNPQILVHDRASYKLLMAVPSQNAARPQ